MTGGSLLVLKYCSIIKINIECYEHDTASQVKCIFSFCSKIIVVVSEFPLFFNIMQCLFMKQS